MVSDKDYMAALKDRNEHAYAYEQIRHRLNKMRIYEEIWNEIEEGIKGTGTLTIEHDKIVLTDNNTQITSEWAILREYCGTELPQMFLCAIKEAKKNQTVEFTKMLNKCVADKVKEEQTQG